jgi:hypothetical protein
MPAVRVLAHSLVQPVPANVEAPVTPSAPVSQLVLDPATQSHRREMLRRAERENVIEGASCNPATQYVREAFIRGDVDHDGAIALLDVHYGLTRSGA